MLKKKIPFLALSAQIAPMARKRDPEIACALGARVRTLRLSTSLTQEALAEKVGVQATAISRFENGIVGFSLATLSDIAEVLQVPLVSLFEFDLPKDQVFSIEEKQLVAAYRSLSDDQRKTLRQVLLWACNTRLSAP